MKKLTSKYHHFARLITIGSLFYLDIGLAQEIDNLTNHKSEDVIRLLIAETDANNPLTRYRRELIRMAMKESGKRFTLAPCKGPINGTSDQRFVELIRSGKDCNLFATSAGSNLTKGLLPIEFPIYLGGGGYRILLANERGLSHAESIKSIEDLQKYSIGLGENWADADIMRENGFKLTFGSYVNLFEMLKANRFDYMNRSIFEAPEEIKVFAPKGELSIVPNLLIIYPTDLFFYTNPKRQDIRSALLTGLVKLYEKGDLQKFLGNHESTARSVQLIQSNKNRIFYLKNDRNNMSDNERRALKTYTMKLLKIKNKDHN